MALHHVFWGAEIVGGLDCQNLEANGSSYELSIPWVFLLDYLSQLWCIYVILHIIVYMYHTYVHIYIHTSLLSCIYIYMLLFGTCVYLQFIVCRCSFLCISYVNIVIHIWPAGISGNDQVRAEKNQSAEQPVSQSQNGFWKNAENLQALYIIIHWIRIHIYIF